MQMLSNKEERKSFYFIMYFSCFCLVEEFVNKYRKLKWIVLVLFYIFVIE